MAFRVINSSSIKNAMQFSDVFVRSMSTGGPKKIGFIGLGNMGGHMASNLMKKVFINNFTQNDV